VTTTTTNDEANAGSANAPGQGGAPGEITLYEGAPALLPSLWLWILAVITLGIAALVLYFRRDATVYRVTNQRIVISRGLFSKRMEQLDLYRIHDYVVEQPLGQRIVGTANLRLSTFDRSSPTVALDGLATDVPALYEKLRSAVELLKQQRGVRVIDNESA